MTMQKQRGNANSETKQTERKSEDEDYSPTTTTNSITKMQKEEYLIKNACCSPAKYYLCKQNNKRSLLGRKQRNQVVRSFPNRYQYSYTKKVTSLFSIRYILIIILRCKEIFFFMMIIFSVYQKKNFHIPPLYTGNVSAGVRLNPSKSFVG